MAAESGNHCYCQERATNLAFAETLKDLPPGYCGICDVCGQPGHMRAHPQLPTTGSWCDEHWQAMLASPGITLDVLFKWAFIAVTVIVVITAMIRWL
ncbi:MAG: hypothetical protein EP312_04725 [Gammaproteobacteria bacterium]|nr:MAG: hypothetical protein EP312_04725 [Gammaproteobacteria bacterium]